MIGRLELEAMTLFAKRYPEPAWKAPVAPVRPERLSTTQQDVLRILAEHGGIIERRRGGFWTYPGCPSHLNGPDDVPDWYVEIRTVRAMTRKGVLRNIEPDEPEWRARREVV